MTTGGLGRARGAAGNQCFIRDQMKSFILERGLKAGDPLPNEQELMAQLGVGRHPLREAMKALQAVGIIEIRHGYGTYVGQVTLIRANVEAAFDKVVPQVLTKQLSLSSALSQIQDAQDKSAPIPTH